MKTHCRLVVVIVLLSCLSLAQTGTSSVRGTISDKTGAAVAGAKVTITNTGQALERETQTNASGEYTFLALPPGSYNLSVEKAGFRTFQRNSMQLAVDVPLTSDVSLVVGTTSEKVEVTAEGATVNTTDASLGNAFSETQVKELPLESRNVPDLLSLQAGVLYTGNSPDIDNSVDTRSGAVNGARSDQSNITVDGVPANPKGGTAFTSVLPVTLDSVQEFRVTTTNYGADQGVSSAAQVALITKSGTNSFHGSVYEYNRNSAFSANDFFIKTSQVQSGEPNKPLQLNRNIFGASLGGPVLTNRFYFFLNYEGYRSAEATDQEQIVPTSLFRSQGIGYYCLDGDTSACPGNTAVINGTSFTAPPGYMILTPAQITQMDSTSFGPHGPNSVVNQYFSTYPLPNDFTVGDGINMAGYRFRASTFTKKNWYIGKLDYNLTADARHRVSLSGALANESDAGAPFLPGQVPETTTLNFNKGLIASYTAVLTPTLLNNFHYGFVRESSGIEGDSSLPWNYINYNFSNLGITRSSSFQRPIHNITDDVSWVHGKHTWQFGAQFSFLRDPESNLNGSFSVGAANPDWLADSGISQSTNPDPLNPSNPSNGYPGVDSSFTSSYDNAIMTLTGMISLGDAVYNYNRSGATLAQGAPVTRRFGADSYEMYAQDSWKVRPNLTLTLGLRYSLFSPPWETNGLQVGTNVNLGNWFAARQAGMYQGLPSSAQSLISYNWAGPANGKAGYYGWDTKNFGPRVAFAWSPDYSDGFLGKLFGGPTHSSIRGGFGIVYDRVGESLVDTFDQNGSFGLNTQLNNPSAFETSQTAPRLSSMNVIPPNDYNTPPQPILEPAPSGGFPQQYPVGLGAITWGLDPNLKTPYSYTMDFALSRELKSNFTLDVAYVGRLSHRLLAQDDLAMPLDIFDKQSGLDYFAAEKALAKVFRPQLVAGASAPTLSFSPNQVPANVQQFWTNQIQPLAAGGAYTLSGCTGGQTLPTTSPVVFAFDNFCSTAFNDSLALYLLDYYGSPDFYNSNQTYYFAGGQYSYYSPQFSSLYAWRSIAWSNYNALQTTLRHHMAHGLQFDFNYTFSKALDISSDAERVGPASNGSFLGLNNNIINAWNPRAQYGPASFDATHQINSNWIYQLPFGRGKMLATDASRGLDAVIGGWQISGLFRWTSGFPVTVDNGVTNFPTNFEMEGNADQVAPVKAGKYFINGVPNIFSNGPAAMSSFAPAYAGESGQRNEIRGEGYFGIDLGLAKRWLMPWSEKQSLQFRWEVFNLTNTPVFDVQSALLSQTLGLTAAPGTFGNYTGLLNNPRIMQFALRFEF
jgi:Carboxypeptidase regulatory-like domain